MWQLSQMHWGFLGVVCGLFILDAEVQQSYYQRLWFHHNNMQNSLELPALNLDPHLYKVFQWNIYCVPFFILLSTFSLFVCLHFLHWHVHRDPRRTRACLDCSINRCSLDLGPARHIWNLYKFHVLCPPRSLQPESVVRIPTISILMCLIYVICLTLLDPA